jgi:SOS response regulatory protein OraA/RecX
VRAFVAEKRRRSGWGLSRLQAELDRRGADSEATQRVLAEYSDDADADLARIEFERWRSRGGDDVDRLTRRLARKGIPTRVIVRLLNEVRQSE